MATQPVSIDDIEFDALITSSEDLSADVPSYPTEDGFEISDSIILKPLALDVTLFLTNTPVTWKTRHGSDLSRVLDVVQQLRDKYFTKQPVTVTTSERTYENMAIVSIQIPKNLETGPSREIPISFQEIIVTESKTTTIPDSYGKSGTTATNAGTASTKKSSTPTPKSGSGSSGGGGVSGSGTGGSGSNSTIAHGLIYGGSKSQNKFDLANLSGLFG